MHLLCRFFATPNSQFSNLVLSAEWNLRRVACRVVSLRLEIERDLRCLSSPCAHTSSRPGESTTELGSFTWLLEARSDSIGWQSVERMQRPHWFSSLDRPPAHGPDPRVSRRSWKSGEGTNLYFDVDKRWCLYNISKLVMIA